MKRENPNLRFELFNSIKVLRMSGGSLLNKHVAYTVRHLNLNRKFKVCQIKIHTCTQLIVKVGSFYPYINWFRIIKFLLPCKIISEIQSSDHIRPDII